MAQIKAFKGLRYDTTAGEISTLACPPYDIISEQERLCYLEANKHNIIRLELPKEGENPYAQAAETLNEWLAQGILKKDAAENIYIYEEQFEVNGQVKKLKGFIGLVRLEEFEKGIVLPHEETLSKAKADRFQLMQATGCNFSQIYSLYMDEDHSVSALVNAQSSNKADVSFTDEQDVIHRMWCVSDAQAIEGIRAAFEDKKLYIADGHHRYETAIHYRNELRAKGLADDENHPANFVMMMLVNMENDGLVVLPTHRIVRDLSDFDYHAVVKACEDLFEIHPIDDVATSELVLKRYYAQGAHSFVLYAGDDKCCSMTLRNMDCMEQIFPQNSAAYKGLDVSVLHTLILEKTLGIDKENMAQQKNLTYTRTFFDAVNAVDEGEANCAFLLNPTRVAEIRDIATAGEKMPQKSTYFYPKLVTGLVMNSMRNCE